MQEAVDVCRVSLNTTIWPLNYNTEMTKVPQGLIASHQKTLLESDRECGCSFSRAGSARHTVLGSTGSSGEGGNHADGRVRNSPGRGAQPFSRREACMRVRE